MNCVEGLVGMNRVWDLQQRLQFNVKLHKCACDMMSEKKFIFSRIILENLVEPTVGANLFAQSTCSVRMNSHPQKPKILWCFLTIFLTEVFRIILSQYYVNIFVASNAFLEYKKLLLKFTHLDLFFSLLICYNMSFTYIPQIYIFPS